MLSMDKEKRFDPYVNSEATQDTRMNLKHNTGDPQVSPAAHGYRWSGENEDSAGVSGLS